MHYPTSALLVHSTSSVAQCTSAAPAALSSILVLLLIPPTRAMTAAAIADDAHSARPTFPFSFHPKTAADDQPTTSTSPYPNAPNTSSSADSRDADISHHIHEGHDHVHPEPTQDLSPPPAKPCTTSPPTTPVVLSPYLSQFLRQSLLHSPLLSVLTSVEEADEPTHLLAFDALVNSCQRVVLPAGEFLVKQDEVGDQFFIVAEGEVDIVKTHTKHAAASNKEQPHSRLKWRSREEKSHQQAAADECGEETTIVAAAGPGAIVGELSVFYDIPRQASLLTRTDVVAYSINRAAFTSFLLSHPLLSNALSHRRWLRSVLQSHYLFAHVEDESEKERLISSFTPLYYGHDDVIIQQGEDADRFYLLEEGRCQVSTLNQTTLESVPVANVHPNQSFGEVALLYATQRSATVRCTSEGGCVVWSVNGREFLQHCQRASLFLQHVFYRFAKQSNEVTQEKLMSKDDFQSAMRFISRFQKYNTADALSSSSSSSSSASVNQSALSDDRLRLMFRLADVSGDSVVCFIEFLQLHILLTHPHSCAELAFRLFDRNSSGEIDRDEFKRVIRWLAEDRGEKLDLSHNKYIQDVFGDRQTLSFSHFSQLLRENSFPSFLSSMRTDLESIDHAMKNLDTSMPLSVALLADNTSLISLPSQLQSIDELDDHLFRLPWRTLIAGGVAGGLSRTLVSPLERLKILFQTQGGEMEAKYTSVRQGLSVIWKEDGLRGLFRGNGSNVLRIVPAVALQFFFYDIFRRFMFDHPFVPITETDSQKRKMELGTVQRLVAGAGAGIAACVLTYPLDFIRARLTLQSGPNALYGGIVDGCRQVYRNEGIRGFYRGLWPSVVGIAPYLGLDFAVYEGLKKCIPVDGEEGKPAKTALFGCGAVAGTVGQCVSYPIDTVRRRLQVQGFGPAAAAYHYGHSIAATMKTIVKEEGVRGLYKGMTANLAKVAPAVSISFVTYEYMRELLGLEGL